MLFERAQKDLPNDVNKCLLVALLIRKFIIPYFETAVFLRQFERTNEFQQSQKRYMLFDRAQKDLPSGINKCLLMALLKLQVILTQKILKNL